MNIEYTLDVEIDNHPTATRENIRSKKLPNWGNSGIKQQAGIRFLIIVSTPKMILMKMPIDC